MRSLRRTALVAVVLSLAVLRPARAADVVTYLPDGTEAVAVLNLKQFFESELIKKTGLDKELTKDEKTRKVLTALGLDPAKDLDRVVIAYSSDAESRLVLIRGSFDPTKFAAQAEEVAKEHKDHVKILKDADATFYEVSGLDEALPLPGPLQALVGGVVPKAVFLAVADKNTLVAAETKEVLKDALAKAAGKKKGDLKSQELAALIAKLDPKQTVALAVPGKAVGQEKIKSITGGFTFAADLKLDVIVATPAADDAKELNQTLEEGLMTAQGFLGGFAAQQPALQPLVDMLNAIKHQAKDKDLVLTATVKGTTLEALLKGIAELQKGF